jgi:hypothetical protein
MEKEKKRGGLLGIVAIVLLVVLIAGGAGAYFTGAIGGAKDGQITTITESTLKEVVEISELSTVEYTYNAVALSYLDEEKTKPKYHVAYEGRVKAGINFKDIGISVDEEQKTIKISIPEVKILDCSVNEGTLEYIFEKDKYNDLTVSSEAYKICKKDLEEKANKEGELLELARDNAISAVKGLIEPWVGQIDNEYTIEVN